MFVASGTEKYNVHRRPSFTPFDTTRGGHLMLNLLPQSGELQDFPRFCAGRFWPNLTYACA